MPNRTRLNRPGVESWRQSPKPNLQNHQNTLAGIPARPFWMCSCRPERTSAQLRRGGCGLTPELHPSAIHLWQMCHKLQLARLRHPGVDPRRCSDVTTWETPMRLRQYFAEVPVLPRLRNFRSGAEIGRGDPGATGRARGGEPSVQPTRCQTPQRGAPRRQRVASGARRGQRAGSSSRTWNLIIFSGLPLGTSILDRMTLPGAHGGCAERYARFWLMACSWGSNFGQAGLPAAIPPGVWATANSDHTTHGVHPVYRSANCHRTARHRSSLVVACPDRSSS
jgi:hypothetical protein